MMRYVLDINDRAFRAIRERRKRTEIRANVPDGPDFGDMMPGDEILFTSYSDEKMLCRVTDVNHYDSIEQLLIMEGTRYTLSSTDDPEQGAKSIRSLNGYADAMEKSGVYAIHLIPEEEL